MFFFHEKASLKSSLEWLRIYTFEPLSYGQLMIDFTFLKQVKIFISIFELFL